MKDSTDITPLYTVSILGAFICWCKQGLHVGGLEDINRLSRLGQIETGDVQVLVGCTAWNPGQLQKEIWLGCWNVLAASNDVLHECLFGGLTLHIMLCALQAMSDMLSILNRYTGLALLPESILCELISLLTQNNASLIAKLQR